MDGKETTSAHTLEAAGQRLNELFQEIFAHDGYGHLEVSIRFLKRKQKEILIKCGKEYRFVVDYPAVAERGFTRTTGTDERGKNDKEVPMVK